MTTRSTRAVVLALALVTAADGVARAQPAPPPSPPPSSGPTPPTSPAPTTSPGPASQDAAPEDAEKKKEEARAHFEKGLSLFDEEAWDAALAEFAQSRAIYPTRSATKNAAICLRKLKRFDESADLFEEMLRFPNLPPADKELAERELKALRALIGAIEIRIPEPGATVTVDGQQRGTAPLAAAVRVAAGSHVVRVFKDGFEPYETRVDVAGGANVVVAAKLAPLTQSGRLKVTEQSGKALDVVVDNVVVGKTPWEGTLAPGDHTVLLRGEGDLGTQPASAPVKLNQVTPLTLVAEELGANLVVQPTPAGASIAVDGVSVGRGLWEGRLRTGAHRVEVASEGFLPARRDLNLAKGAKEKVVVQLQRDPDSELWTENRPRFFAEVDAKFAVLPSFGGDVAGCSDPCSSGVGVGFRAMARGGYEFRSGLGLGLEAGYLLLTQSVEGRATTLEPTGLTNPGFADDSLRLGGLMVGANAGLHFRSDWPLTLRLGAGALLGSLSDRRSGRFTTEERAGHPSVEYEVDGIRQSLSASYFYLTPEARLGVKLGENFEVSAGLEAVLLFALSKPKWVPNDSPVAAATDGQGTFNEEALTADFVVALAPGLGARYDF